MALAVAASAVAPPVAGACSAFLATGNGLVLFGNNEDSSNPATRMWFVPGKLGTHGRVYFGYDDLLPQGGMNEAGLVYDGFAARPKLVTTSPEKPPIGEYELIDTAMATCATVPEVLVLFSRYNLQVMETFTLMFADRNGDSVIIEGDAVLRKAGRFQVQTNFRQSEHPGGIDAYGAGQSCARFAIASAMLATDEPISVGRVRQILAAIHVEGRPTGRPQTLYSNIYDLQRRIVYIYSFHDFQHKVVIDLAAELNKGRRIVDLPALFPRTYAREAFVAEKEAEREQRRAGRPTVELPTGALQRFVGRYGETCALGPVTVSLDGGVLVADYPGSGPLRLDASSPTEYFHLRLDKLYDVDIVFREGDGGTIDGLQLRTGERNEFCRRLP